MPLNLCNKQPYKAGRGVFYDIIIILLFDYAVNSFLPKCKKQ